MNQLPKLPIALVVATSIHLVFASAAYAAGSCIPIYGGGVSCPSVVGETIDKMILNPVTREFVDGLGPTNDIASRYEVGQTVVFRIRVKNSADVPVVRAIVKDTPPRIYMCSVYTQIRTYFQKAALS